MLDKICANCHFFEKTEGNPPYGQCNFKLPSAWAGPFYSKQTDGCDLWRVVDGGKSDG